MFAERLKDTDAAVAAEVTRRGRESVLAALGLCQLIYDYGGSVLHNLDELNAVLNADRVAAPGWEAETLRRLHERVGQLRAAGEPGLAKRVRRIISAKRSSAPLCDLVATAREQRIADVNANGEARASPFCFGSGLDRTFENRVRLPLTRLERFVRGG